jgi:large conductance mechanosensitive channel
LRPSNVARGRREREAGEQLEGCRVLKEFRQFVLRGNVIDLAVGVVIGAAFTAIVTAFVKDLITPLIAAIGGQPDFSGIYFTINNSRFLIGDFINSVVSFLIIAAVVFFFVVKPVNTLMRRFKSEEPTPAPTRECPYCISKIPRTATRCAFCTQEVPPVAALTTTRVAQ